MGTNSHGQPQMCMSLPCSVAAVRMADGLTFVIYEFWETEEEWKRLVQPCPYPMPGRGGHGKMELAGSLFPLPHPEDL